MMGRMSRVFALLSVALDEDVGVIGVRMFWDDEGPVPWFGAGPWCL